MSISKEEAQAMVEAAVRAATTPLQTKLDELAAKAAPTSEPAPPKVYTKAELRAAIDAGSITEIQAEDILERQREAETRRLAREAAAEAVSSDRTMATVADGLAAYKELVPDLLVEGSKDRQRAKAKFEYLVGLGQPKTHATELVALESIYGPVDKLRAARGATNDIETHEEGSGGDGSGSRSRGAPTKLKLSAAQKDYYTDLVNKGLYTWERVEKELKRAKPATRQRSGQALH